MNPDRNTSIKSLSSSASVAVSPRALHAVSRGSVGLHVALARCNRCLSLRHADGGAVDHLAVEHRVLDDVHGSTALVSMPPQLRSRAAVTPLLTPNIAARERSNLPGSRHGAETLETYGEAMTDADSSTELGA
jgi:hypothetical protein